MNCIDPSDPRLLQVDTNAVAEYLKRSGWVEVNEEHERIRVFVIEESQVEIQKTKERTDTALRLVIPRRGVADYPYRMAEAIRTIAENEDRSPNKVINAICPPKKNLKRIVVTIMNACIVALVGGIIAIYYERLSSKPEIEISYPEKLTEVLCPAGEVCTLRIEGRALNVPPGTDVFVALSIRPTEPAGSPWYAGEPTSVRLDGTWSLSTQLGEITSTESSGTCELYEIELKLLKRQSVGEHALAFVLSSSNLSVYCRRVDRRELDIAPQILESGGRFFTYPKQLPVRIGTYYSATSKRFYIEFSYMASEATSEEGWGYTFNETSPLDVNSSESLILCLAGSPSSAKFKVKLEDTYGTQGTVEVTVAEAWETKVIPITVFERDQPSLRLDSIAQVTFAFTRDLGDISLRTSKIYIE